MKIRDLVAAVLLGIGAGLCPDSHSLLAAFHDDRICSATNEDVTESPGAGFYTDGTGQQNWRGTFDITFDCTAGELTACSCCYYYSITESDSTTGETDDYGSGGDSTGTGLCEGGGDENITINIFDTQNPLYSYSIYFWVIPKPVNGQCPGLDQVETGTATAIFDL